MSKHYCSGTACTRPHILLAEDDELLRTAYRRYLTDEGYCVFEAENGKIALQLWLEQRDQIDLIITDYRMPEMNGDVFISAVHEVDPNAKAIMLTGNVRQLLKELSLIALLDKSININDLISIIKNACQPCTA